MAPPSDNRDASMSGLVTLTTDFGSADGYAGAVKGVLLAACRELRVIDITHDLPMGDVLAGAVGTVLAQGADPAEGAALAVSLHAQAGDLAADELGQAGLLPQDVAHRLGRVARDHRG